MPKKPSERKERDASARDETKPRPRTAPADAGEEERREEEGRERLREGTDEIEGVW